MSDNDNEPRVYRPSRFPDEEPEVMDEEEIENRIELNREKAFQTYAGNNKAFRRNWPKKLLIATPEAAVTKSH